MALTRKSKMREIFENEQAYEILLKHVPTCSKDAPGMGPAMGMSAQALLSFPQTKCDPRSVLQGAGRGKYRLIPANKVYGGESVWPVFKCRRCEPPLSK